MNPVFAELHLIIYFFYYSQMLHITEAHQTQEQSESVVAESKWFKETA